MATKRTKTRTNSSRYLPIDVVSEILSRLPSKSLLRFRCVCKSWRDLITDPIFVESHRNQNNNSHILIQYDRSNFSLLCEKTFVARTTYEFVSHTGHELGVPKLIVLGYSNGLVCLKLARLESFDLKFEICLWNPSIRKLMLIPDSPSHTTWGGYAKFAFAFVPQINDYRVLKIMCRHDHTDVVVQSEIYSLRTNSWKIVEHEVNCQLEENAFERSINGVVHFMDANNDSMILSFNMADEVFRKIMIPKAFNQLLAGKELYLQMFGELLLVIRFFREHSKPIDVDIWVINEHGAVESLNKKLSFDDWILPLGFLENGELVFSYANTYTTNKFSSYDPILSEIKDLQFIGAPKYLQTITHYMESLVLLNDPNLDEKRWNPLIQVHN